MKNQENRLDQLFDRAKHQIPQASFNETKRRLLPAISVGLLAGLFAKWAVLSTKFKLIIMLSTITLISTSALLIASSLSSTIDGNEKVIKNHTIPSDQNMNLTSEGGITKSVYYDKNELIIKTMIDSSLKLLVEEFILPEETITLRTLEAASTISKELLEPSNFIQPLDKNLLADKQDTIRYKIDENTTKSELDAIQAEALKAGIDFSVTTKIRISKIKRLKLNMTIGGEGKSSSKITFHFSSGNSFNYTFGWALNDEGKATKFVRTKLKNSLFLDENEN